MSLLRRILGGMVGLAATRLELLALEIERERQRLARQWVSAAVALALLFMGTALGVVWLLLWVEPEQRVTLAGALALGFLGAAALAAWRCQGLARTTPALARGLLGDLQRAQRRLSGETEVRSTPPPGSGTP